MMAIGKTAKNGPISGPRDGRKTFAAAAPASAAPALDVRVARQARELGLPGVAQARDLYWRGWAEPAEPAKPVG